MAGFTMGQSDSLRRAMTKNRTQEEMEKITAYLKARYPAEFLAGILSCEPMEFYPGNVILEEARRMGVGILGVNINRSRKRFSVENGKIRIGLMQVKGISEAEIDSILKTRDEGMFASLSDFCFRTRVSRPAVENLIYCGGRSAHPGEGSSGSLEGCWGSTGSPEPVRIETVKISTI